MVHSWPHAWWSLQGTLIGLWLPSHGHINPSHRNTNVPFNSSPVIILISQVSMGSRITKQLLHRSSHSFFQKLVSPSLSLTAHAIPPHLTTSRINIWDTTELMNENHLVLINYYYMFYLFVLHLFYWCFYLPDSPVDCISRCQNRQLHVLAHGRNRSKALI